MDLSEWIPKDWSDWAGVAQVLQFVIVLISLPYAKGQVDEAARGRKLQATRELLNEIGNEEVRILRSWVLDEMPSPDALTIEQHRQARRVAISLDRVGYMVKQRLIPEDALFEWQQDEILQLWKKLEQVVKDVREIRNRPHYCNNFQYLATEWLPRMVSKGN